MSFKLVICTGFLIVSRLLYRYGTVNKKIVTIKEKQIHNQILTHENEVYNIITNFENMSNYPLWHTFNTGETIEITYYGVRLPMFGIYPNIYKIHNERWLRELRERQSESQKEAHVRIQRRINEIAKNDKK
jgi:hypothetical protein